MKKLLILAIALISVLILATSCMGIEVCPTYSHSSIKQYGPKYMYAKAPVKKQKRAGF